MTQSSASFSEAWLVARERIDSAARDRGWPAIALQFHAHLQPITRVIDLGCGSGSNLRYLRTRLPPLMAMPIHHWWGIDADQLLLDAAGERNRVWDHQRDHQRAGAAVSSSLRKVINGVQRSTPRQVIDGVPHLNSPRYLPANLADPNNWPAFSATDLVSASALIDLVSESWLTELIRRCANARSALLLALTYDGRSIWRPAHPHDGPVLSAFNRDQISDKGFGLALGPQAAAVVQTILARAAYSVWRARSDWHLDARWRADRRVLATLIADHHKIALRTKPAASVELEHWAAQRQRQLHCGRLKVRIGHIDILALPGCS